MKKTFSKPKKEISNNLVGLNNLIKKEEAKNISAAVKQIADNRNFLIKFKSEKKEIIPIQ